MITTRLERKKIKIKLEGRQILTTSFFISSHLSRPVTTSMDLSKIVINPSRILVPCLQALPRDR